MTIALYSTKLQIKIDSTKFKVNYLQKNLRLTPKLPPFGKSFKEREYTVKEAPVFADTRYESFDMNNLVSIKFIYNFSFGRNRNEEGPRVEGNDNDSGILRK